MTQTDTLLIPGDTYVGRSGETITIEHIEPHPRLSNEQRVVYRRAGTPHVFAAFTSAFLRAYRRLELPAQDA